MSTSGFRRRARGVLQEAAHLLRQQPLAGVEIAAAVAPLRRRLEMPEAENAALH